jgi:hypothetical protein
MDGGDCTLSDAGSPSFFNGHGQCAILVDRNIWLKRASIYETEMAREEPVFDA